MNRGASSSELSPRRRVEIALRGGCGDRVPFTMYESKIPQCVAERRLRNRGMCIVRRDVPVYRSHYPNVKQSREIFDRGGKTFTRHVYETLKGTLTTLDEAAGFTHWRHEKMFKSPDDYPALLALIEDEQFEPCYDVFARVRDAVGEDAIFRSNFGLEPMQTLISGVMMSMQDYCEQWMDNRDEILKLYHAIVRKHRQIYPIVAESPVGHANYGGNVTPEIIGLRTFEDYYLQHYNEAAEVMHKHGKLIGCHFDANCKLLSKAIASTDLDYIEAFTPAPDTDMTLGEARQVWPNKVIWINFPSSQHLRTDEQVERITCDLLDDAGRLDGLLFSVTEDVPEHRWQDSCLAIMNGLDRHAANHPEKYQS
jgi:hypothetical protein